MKTVGWEQTTGNSRLAQIREIEDAYEYYHPVNKKTHKAKKSYIFTKKLRDLVKPSRENNGGAHNTKNIQSMIDYLQAKFDLDDNWYSFTDWYCEKLELMYKGICNAMYYEDEIDAVCEEYSISDGKLFFEYVSAAKAELKNMFLKSLGYLEKKNKITYHDEYKFIYQLGKRTIGDVITDCLNDVIKEIETTVCNGMNEEYDISKKMRGRQLLKIIYSKKSFTEEFKEFCLLALNDNDDVLKKLNCELSYQHPTFHPDYSSICKERPLISYYRGISITDMELKGSDKKYLDTLALDITNRIRTKVRELLKKSYRKFMKQSDLKAIEKALFRHYDDEFADKLLYLTEDDISDIEQVFGERKNFTDNSDNWSEPIPIEHNFFIEEILNMPTEGEVQMNLANMNCVGQDELCKNESQGEKIRRELFYATGKDSDCIDIDNLF